MPNDYSIRFRYERDRKFIGLPECFYDEVLRVATMWRIFESSLGYSFYSKFITLQLITYIYVHF